MENAVHSPSERKAAWTSIQREAIAILKDICRFVDTLSDDDFTRPSLLLGVFLELLFLALLTYN